MVVAIITTIFFGSFVTRAQNTCDQKALVSSFTQLDDLPGYIKTDSSTYEATKPTADKKIFIIYKGKTVDSLNFDAVKETKRYTQSGVFFKVVISSSDKNRCYFYLKGEPLTNLLLGLKNVYYKVRIDREHKRLLLSTQTRMV